MTWAERVRDAWDNPNLNWDLAARVERQRKRTAVALLSPIRWDIYWTQTYRGQHSEVGAQQRWLRFLAESSLLSILAAHMWAVEPHASTPSHHVHALLSMKSLTSLGVFWKEWRGWKERAWGTMGKALILRTSETAPIWYVLKYVLKEASGGSATTMGNGRNRSAENLWGIWTACNESGIH